MKNHWLLNLLPATVQNDSYKSFIGGKPCLPTGTEIPSCTLCNREQTFFFQVAFPARHPWADLTLAAFQCTSCANENFLIPEMLQQELKGVDIPHSFLKTYQRNFRFLVFHTNDAKIIPSYEERIVFHPWSLEFSASSRRTGTIVGGAPRWILGDETPGAYSGTLELYFLMQLKSEFTFPIHVDAPQQVKVTYAGGVWPDEAFYSLFLQNEVYFFGTDPSQSEPLVYCITQVD